uniref:FtsX-like permease family protein n=1 Tax=Rhizomonospora bruguierae TaxID=1581705 RepID=UPI0027DBCBE7
VEILAAGDRSSPLAYAAPPLVALLAGLVAARVLGRWARRRARRMADRGRLPAVLTAASLARRPATGRVVALLTVAVALLTFAATGWDVAAGNRERTARAAVGAPWVYRVDAPDPGTLLKAVRRADPGGERAMAVGRWYQFYGEGDTIMVGVDSARLPAIGVWPGGGAGTLASVRDLLRPDAAPGLPLHGPTVTVEAATTRATATRPMSLAIILDDGTGPRRVDLGELAPGSRGYTAPLTGCADGCRLMALSVRRFPGDEAPIAATLTIGNIRDADATAPAGLTDPRNWRAAPAARAGQRLDLSFSPAGLGVALESTAPEDAVIEYADTPTRLPTVLAGPAPADDADAGEFAFPAFGSAPDQWRVAGRFPALPGAGARAMLFDLETEVHQAVRVGLAAGSRSQFEVWTRGPMEPGLRSALAAAGVRVVAEHSLAAERVALARFAPALALRLYLAAGATALLLAVGMLLLTASVGVRARLRELHALRLVGVPHAVLRRALRGEYAGLLATAILVGVPAGIAGAALLLPAIPLVSIDQDALAPVYRLAGWWLPGAVALLLAVLAGTVMAAPRLVRRAERPAPR